MNIIKEVSKNNVVSKVVIRTNTYTNSFSHFLMLVEIAKKDFPSLENESIEIVQYAGERYKRTYGIEFHVLPQDVPQDYQEINDLECTF